MTIFVVVLIGMMFIDCASTTANLQRETARFISEAFPEEVTVSKYQ